MLREKDNTSGLLKYIIKLDDHDVFVNYDRAGNLLLGMDILSEWSFIIDKSKINNKTTFIACPRDRLNQEFYLAIEREFGLAEKLNSAIVNNTLNNGGNYESN